jgi:NAD(P)-dependent dehydrogenase (short-subunit alcohol dehydrogenase family)
MLKVIVEELPMNKRVAVVTGATRGIGKGIFRRLLREGHSVATIHHRDENAAEVLRQEAIQAGVACIVKNLDVSQLAALPRFIEEVQEQFGRVDFLINNVGIDDFNSVYELSLDDWRKSQDIILNAPFVLMKAVLPLMRRNGFGRIVNIGASSNDYLKGARNAGAFGVHKAALSVLTKTVAVEEMAHGITVNMVAPGSTAGAGILEEKDRIPVSAMPLGRRVSVDEVVAAVMYFLSEEAGAVTGQVLGVNGGMST